MSHTTRTLFVSLAICVTTTAFAGKRGWDAPPKKFTGKTSSRTKFTIQLPSSLEQKPSPVDYMFELEDAEARLSVGSMIAFAQHKKSFAEYKAKWLKDAKILREEPGDTAWAVLFVNPVAPDLVTALFASPTGDSQSTCMWDVPKAAVKDGKLASWDVMKKACRTIEFTY